LYLSFNILVKYHSLKHFELYFQYQIANQKVLKQTNK
jgi:hypothetical protein